MRQKNSTWLRTFLVIALACLGSAIASEPSAIDEHAGHRKMMSEPVVKVEQVVYQVPDISMVDSSGSVAKLRDVLATDRPVILNFIFTTCTTICPVLTATTLQVQQQLLGDAVQPNYVSISIDPDYDSSDVLQRYAKQYGADWTFLTGSPGDVMTTLQAFDAYRGNKVNHFALTLMRAANAEPWTRVEGLTSAHELARIWRATAL